MIGENIKIQNGFYKNNIFTSVGETDKTDNVKITVFATTIIY